MNKLELYNGFFRKNWKSMSEVFEEVLNTNELDNFYDVAIFEMSIASELFPYSNLEKKLKNSRDFVNRIITYINAENDVDFDFTDLLNYSLGFDLDTNLENATIHTMDKCMQRVWARFNGRIELPYLFRHLGFVKESFWDKVSFNEYTFPYKDDKVTISSDVLVFADIIFEYGESKFEEFSKTKMSNFFQKLIESQFEKSHFYRTVKNKEEEALRIVYSDSYMQIINKPNPTFDELIHALTEFKKEIQVKNSLVYNKLVSGNLIEQAKLTYCALAHLVIKDNSYLAYVRLAKCARAIRVLNTKLYPL